MSKNRRKKNKKALRAKRSAHQAAAASGGGSSSLSTAAATAAAKLGKNQNSGSDANAAGHGNLTGNANVSNASVSASAIAAANAKDERVLKEKAAQLGITNEERTALEKKTRSVQDKTKAIVLEEQKLEQSIQSASKEKEEEFSKLVKSQAPVGDKLKRLHAACVRLLHDNKRIQTEILFLSQKYERNSGTHNEERKLFVKSMSDRAALETYCMILEDHCPPDIMKKISKSYAVPESIQSARKLAKAKREAFAKLISEEKQRSPGSGSTGNKGKHAKKSSGDNKSTRSNTKSDRAWDPVVMDRLLLPRSDDSMEELHEKLQFFSDQYAVREQHFSSILRSKELENLYIGARLKQQLRAVTKADSQVQTLKQHANALSQTENELRGQLALYAEKFEQFQMTLTKSNEVFNTFKQEMERMTKTIKKLEKDNLALRQKREKAELRAIEMQEDRNTLVRKLETLNSRNKKLEQLCRALQADRKKNPVVRTPAPSNDPPLLPGELDSAEPTEV